MNQLDYDRSSDPMLWEMKYQEGDPECAHKLPGDWEFGGATGEDPRTDPRWRPQTFVYFDRLLRVRHTTTEPFCVHVATGFYKVALEERLGFKIYYITATDPGGSKGEMIYQDMEGATSATDEG